MATVIRKGWAKPDDEIYTRGAVIGAVRFRPKPKTETQIWLQAEQRLYERIKVQLATQDDDEAFDAGEAAYFADLDRRRPDISQEEADELQWFKEQK